MNRKYIRGLTAFSAMAISGPALADKPADWQIGLQSPATGLMRDIVWFEAYTLWFIVPITLLVLGLLLWAMFRYRESANPTPARTSHNTLIEIIWTLGPVIVLLFIAIPSFQILNEQLTPPEDPDITIKATGYQWYWGYEYQEEEDPLSFDAVLLRDEDREAAGKADLDAFPRLLAVDNELVIPVGATVRLLSTAADVIHSFAVPAFGIKIDAVPGRLNEAWFRVDREGLYYGQCSELCGKDHAFMPIAVRVVSQEQYDTWIASARQDLAGANRDLMAKLQSKKKVAAAGAAATQAN